MIRQPFERVRELTAAGIMPTEVAAHLSAFEPSAQGEPIKPVLLHGDLHPRHVYAAEGELTGYGIERTPELDRTLAFYRVTWSLMALHWEHAAGGDWFAAHVDAIRSDLNVRS